MGRPVLLDLFCGIGGSAVGYDRAGFDVVGVDSVRMKKFPFELVLADALEYLDGLTEPPDAVHASPPCEVHSTLLAGRPLARAAHRDYVAETRDRLVALGVPYVIENVPGAPLLEPLVLCGSMFGLGSGDRQLRRHRLFESSVALVAPGECDHRGKAVGCYGHGLWDTGGAYQGSAAECREAMGIDWAGRDGVNRAVPPAYTEWVGRQLLEALDERSRDFSDHA